MKTFYNIMAIAWGLIFIFDMLCVTHSFKESAYLLILSTLSNIMAKLEQ